MVAESFFASDEVEGVRGAQDDEVSVGDVHFGRDLFFDPFLTCHHPGVGTVSEKLTTAIASVSPPRQRARRPRDAENHSALVAAIAANLALAVVMGQSPPLVAVSLRKPERKRSRYEPSGLRQLATVVPQLAKAGAVELSKSKKRGKASTIEPVPDLVAAIRALDDLSPASFGRADGEETIILARTTVDVVKQQRESELVDYEDTFDTIRFREEMRRINDHLAHADVGYVGPVCDESGRLLDPSPRARFLHRTFSIPAPKRERFAPLPPVADAEKRFDRGGRLYHRGIFWQQLGKDLRRHVRIDGEETAYLDFASMYLRLALLSVGVEPPAGDLYRTVAGIETEEHRDGIKKVLNAMLFRKGDLERLPRGTRDLLPETLRSARAVSDAIKSAFADLVPIFGTRKGFELTFTESQILVAALLRLNEKGITALPIHDGMMVPKSRADEAKRLIDEVSAEVVSFVLPLTVK
jgi:hypothetical protein